MTDSGPLAPDPQVLGSILLLQSTLHAAPDEDRLADMLAQNLSALPGVREALVCISGSAVAADETCSRRLRPYPEASNNADSPFLACPPECPIEQERKWPRLAMRTDKCEYGAAFLDIDDADVFAPYEPFVRNTANLVALFIENRRHEKELETVNATLDKRVDERTQELREINESLQREKLLLQAVMDGIPDIIGIQRPDHTIIRYNKAGYEALGMAEDQVYDRKCYELLGRQAPPEQCATSLAVATGRMAEIERFVPELGRHFLCRSIPVLDGKGKVSLIVEQLHDLTEQKDAEARLRESQERLRFVSGNTSDGIILIDKGIITYASPAYARILGYACESEIGRTADEIIEMIHPEDRESVLSVIEDAKKEGQTEATYCFRARSASGRYVWREDKARFVYDSDGVNRRTVVVARDITERKRAEEALKESEANFRLFFESMTDIMVVATPEARVLFTNEAARDKLGYTEDELGTMHLLDWHRPEDRDEAEAIFAEMLRGEQDHCPLPLMAKDGTTIPVETRVWFGKWSGQDCVFGVCKDLSAEQEAQQRFERIFRRNPSPMALSSILDRRFVDVNEAFLETTGYTREEIIGKTSAELGLVESPDEQDGVVKTLRAKGHIANHELQVRRKDGALRDGLFSGEVIHSQGRECFLTVMIDITERKRAEAELRLQSLVLDQIHDSVTVTDLDGTITYVNNTAACSLGYSRDELIGVSTEKYGEDAEHGATQRQIVEETLEHGEWRGEVVNRTANGEEVILDCRTQVVLDEKGHKVALAGIATDITDIRRAEQERLEMERQIQHTQKLESLGVLAGGIAHDFNNLLMSILGHADLALDELTPTSPARANIEQIETASRRAADLCAQMLAYSGRGRFIIEAFDVSTLIEEMAHLLRTSISKKAILNLQVEKNLPKIQGDATQIRQVIMNLVINASEAIGERSGVISVATGACHCRAEDLQGAYLEGHKPEGLHIFIEVADTGCGMDQETLDRLFEPFFTTKFTGRGLGMSAVLGIVRGHRGILKVNSERGKGTTFRILLPPSEDTDSDNACEQKAVSGMPAPNARVLLVEDEESVRALGQKMLERIGFQVTTASDGRQAVEVYGREGEMIDLVVLDLTMPHMDGEETLRELKRIDPEVRIVMASGYSNHEIEARLAGQGLLGFIQKPYTMAQLKERLYPLFEK